MSSTGPFCNACNAEFESPYIMNALLIFLEKPRDLFSNRPWFRRIEWIFLSWTSMVAAKNTSKNLTFSFRLDLLSNRYLSKTSNDPVSNSDLRKFSTSSVFIWLKSSAFLDTS